MAAAPLPGRLRPRPAGRRLGRQPGPALQSTRIDGRPFTLRWVLLHLIEETARHAGQADLLREAIDGTVGE